MTRRQFPEKRVVVAFPPRRRSTELKRVTDGQVVIGADKIRQSQLPDEVITPDGVVLRRPKHWS